MKTVLFSHLFLKFILLLNILVFKKQKTKSRTTVATPLHSAVLISLTASLSLGEGVRGWLDGPALFGCAHWVSLSQSAPCTPWPLASQAQGIGSCTEKTGLVCSCALDVPECWRGAFQGPLQGLLLSLDAGDACCLCWFRASSSVPLSSSNAVLLVNSLFWSASSLALCHSFLIISFL